MDVGYRNGRKKELLMKGRLKIMYMLQDGYIES